ncbi:putative F-box domain-containing protein [Helianthus anomalus]
MNRNQNDGASSSKSLKSSDNNGLSSLSNLDHDLLLPIMMDLGPLDFLAFSGVCKSWRRLRRKFKTNLPNSTVSTCVGLTRGYLIFFRSITCEFWLVNPLTRCELHFPNFPSSFKIDTNPSIFRGILVFSPSRSHWVLVIWMVNVDQNVLMYADAMILPNVSSMIGQI